VNGAGGLDGLDFSAAGADEVIAVLTGLKQGEVGGAFVKAKAADDAMVGEALEQAVDRGLVVKIGEPASACEFGKLQRARILDQCVEQFFECFGAAQAELTAAFDGFSDRFFGHL